MVLYVCLQNWRVVEDALYQIAPMHACAMRPPELHRYPLAQPVTQRVDRDFSTVTILHFVVLGQEEVQLQSREQRLNRSCDVEVARGRGSFDLSKDLRTFIGF